MIELYYRDRKIGISSKVSHPVAPVGTDGDLGDVIHEATFDDSAATQQMINACDWWGLTPPASATLNSCIHDDNHGADYRQRLTKVIEFSCPNNQG